MSYQLCRLGMQPLSSKLFGFHKIKFADTVWEFYTVLLYWATLHGATSQQESFDFCRLLLFLLLRATHLSSEKSDVEDTGGYSIPFTKVVDIRISKYVVHTPFQTFQLMLIRGSNQGLFWVLMQLWRNRIQEMYEQINSTEINLLAHLISSTYNFLTLNVLDCPLLITKQILSYVLQWSLNDFYL